jgi:hypothetical protein
MILFFDSPGVKRPVSSIRIIEISGGKALHERLSWKQYGLEESADCIEASAPDCRSVQWPHPKVESPST